MKYNSEFRNKNSIISLFPNEIYSGSEILVFIYNLN